MLRFVFAELLGLLAVLGWLLLGVLFLCALPYVVRQAEGDGGAPVSGVRDDCRGYVAVEELPGNSLPPCGELLSRFSEKKGE